jgi:hypothetical protein
MRRAFRIDALACPCCGGRLRLLATITDLIQTTDNLPRDSRHSACDAALRPPTAEPASSGPDLRFVGPVRRRTSTAALAETLPARIALLQKGAPIRIELFQSGGPELADCGVSPFIVRAPNEDESPER